MDSEERIDSLVGRWIDTGRNRGPEERYQPIYEACVDKDGEVLISFGDKTHQNAYWTKRRLSHWKEDDHGLMSADWSPPEPEPERKAEVDPLQEELWRFHKDSSFLGINCDSKQIADEAAKIRAMLGAPVEDIRVGKKVLYKKDDKYYSPWAGRNPWGTGTTLEFAVGKWTEAPVSGDITVCGPDDTTETSYSGVKTESFCIAICVYEPGDNPQSSGPHARRMMLIEELVPVAEAQDKFPTVEEWQASLKPSADEVRELAEALCIELPLGLNLAQQVARAALSYCRYRPRSPLRVCTVSDDELARQAHAIESGHDDWKNHSESFKESWRKVVRKIRERLLGDDAVNVDFVVSGHSGTITPVSEAAKVSRGMKCWRGTDSQIREIYHGGFTVLLAENWKGSADVR